MIKINETSLQPYFDDLWEWFTTAIGVGAFVRPGDVVVTARAVNWVDRVLHCGDGHIDVCSLDADLCSGFTE